MNSEFQPARRPRGRGKAWTTTELRKLRRLYPAHPAKDLAKNLGRTFESVKAKAEVLGVRRNRDYQCWTATEVLDLRRLYPNTFPRDLVRHFGRAIGKIHNAASRYGIKKDSAFIRETGRIAAAHPHAVAARFPKGHLPANKGLRRPGWFRGRMPETQFKKGQRPHTWLPVGTIQANTDGYLRMKVRDDSQAIGGKGASNSNWMYVHRMVWEMAHGPLPPGHRIWWKDGNHRNCDLENLELLTDQEHMARTTIHNLPPDVKQVIMLNGALKRRIARLERNGKKQNLGPAGPSLRDAGAAQGQRAAHGA